MFDTVKSGCPLYILRGSQVKVFKKKLYLKVNFRLANSADPDEMPHYAAFHLGLQCLPKYPFRGFRYAKG